MRSYTEIHLTEKIPNETTNPQDLEIKESSKVKESMRWNGRVFVTLDGNEEYGIRIDEGGIDIWNSSTLVQLAFK